MENFSKNNWSENKWFLLVISLVYLDTIVTHKELIFWAVSPFYLILIVRYVVKSRGYKYRVYIHSIFSLLVLECLLLIYIYLFNHALLKIPFNLLIFLGTVILTIMGLFIFIRPIVTGEYKKISGI